MTEVTTVPEVRVPFASVAALRDLPTPRSPLEFLELEQRVQALASQESDTLLGYHLVRAHEDVDFVQEAVRAARAQYATPLIHKGGRVLTVLLPGGTRYLVKTPYLRPAPPRQAGRKRRRRGLGGAGCYPVLEALGIRDRVSPATRSELALYAVQAGSYQEALVLLSAQGLNVDASTLLRVAQSTAQADVALRDAALERARAVPLGTDGPLAGLRVRISVDGGRVRTRCPHRGRKTQKGRHRFETPWREPRVLVLDILDDQGRTDPLRLPLYDVLLDDADATMALLSGYLRLLGAAHAREIVFIADGADWIWERLDGVRQAAQIPPERWVEVIDFYHAAEHLHHTVQPLWPKSQAAACAGFYEGLRHDLRNEVDGVDQVIASLEARARKRRTKKIATAIQYFEKHRQRMAYVDLDRRQLPVGSGAVESAVRRIINLRFKAPGTFWDPQTVEDLMHLRAAFKAGRWQEVIQRVLTGQYELPSFKPLSQAQIRALLPLDPEEATAAVDQANPVPDTPF